MITTQAALIALGGGALIGTAATLLLALGGRVAGVSGIVGGLLDSPAPGDRAWRLAFIAGLVGAGLILAPALPDAFSAPDRAAWLIVPAGVLVGVGTRMANGCTSGHGVCGLARFSPRSGSAVVVFLGTGIATATAVGLLSRGLP